MNKVAIVGVRQNAVSQCVSLSSCFSKRSSIFLLREKIIVWSGVHICFAWLAEYCNKSEARC